MGATRRAPARPTPAPPLPAPTPALCHHPPTHLSHTRSAYRDINTIETLPGDTSGLPKIIAKTTPGAGMSVTFINPADATQSCADTLALPSPAPVLPAPDGTFQSCPVGSFLENHSQVGCWFWLGGQAGGWALGAGGQRAAAWVGQAGSACTAAAATRHQSCAAHHPPLCHHLPSNDPRAEHQQPLCACLQVHRLPAVPHGQDLRGRRGPRHALRRRLRHRAAGRHRLHRLPTGGRLLDGSNHLPGVRARCASCFGRI